MENDYKPIQSMKKVPEQLRMLRRGYIRYQQAALIYAYLIRSYWNLPAMQEQFIDLTAPFLSAGRFLMPIWSDFTNLPLINTGEVLTNELKIWMSYD